MGRALEQHMSDTLKVYSQDGKPAGTVTVDPTLKDTTASTQLLKQAIEYYVQRAAQHTSHTKTRGNVRGGGRKPFRQKGTGRARAGSTRSPIWRGGGTVFGPQYTANPSLKLNRKMARLALRVAVQKFIAANRVILVNDLNVKLPKTSAVVALLQALPIQEARSALVVTHDRPVTLLLGIRNLPYARHCSVSDLTVYTLLQSDWLIMTREAFQELTKNTPETAEKPQPAAPARSTK